MGRRRRIARLLLPDVAPAPEPQNPEGAATLRIAVAAAGRDTGEPPVHRAFQVVDVETGADLVTMSTEEMLDPAGAPCPGVIAATCSIELTLTVRSLGTFLRVVTDSNPNGRLAAFSADCDGGVPFGGTGYDTFGALRLATGESKTCRVTLIAPDDVIGPRPTVGLLVRKTFDLDTRGAGLTDGFVTLEDAIGGPIASMSVSDFYDLSNRTGRCPQTGPPPACEWALIFDDDALPGPFRVREATEPIWLPIFGGDCDRGGGLPLEASLGGDLVVCTIHNVSLEDDLTPDRNAVIRVEVVAPREFIPADHLPIGVLRAASGSGKTIYAMVEPDGDQCDGLGPVVCLSDVGVAVDPSLGSTGDRFWLTVPPGLTAGATGDCTSGANDSDVAAELDMRVGELKTCRLTVTLPLPLLNVGDASVIEGNSGLRSVSVPVTLSRPQSADVTVDYAVSNGTAAALDDYSGASGTLTFAPGQTLATISFSVVGEILGEPSETVFVTLSSPVGAALQDKEAVVTIVNDDDRTPPVIAVKKDVIVESKVTPVAVLYTSPTATDNLDGAVVVTCLAKSGSAFPFGTTPIACSSKDRNGNLATSTVNVVVRTPTTSGAVTNPGNDTPLTKVSPGRRVRVSAGGFAPGSAVTALWLGWAGEVFDLGATTAAADGRIDARVKVPEAAPLGTAQVTAVGVDATGAEFVRAWRLEVRAE